MTEPLATISPSPIRRAVAVLFLVFLGGMLIYLAFVAPARNLGWQALLLAFGGLCLYGAEQLRRATEYHIYLLDQNIVDSSGRELCRFDNIKGVERGAFAFKPSNGFLLRLKDPLPLAWAPGLWWRYGRRVGVGGVTPASEAKFMAEFIALRLAEQA